MSFTRSVTLSFVRIRAVADLAISRGGLLAGILFLTALFTHSHLTGRAGVIALAISLLALE